MEEKRKNRELVEIEDKSKEGNESMKEQKKELKNQRLNSKETYCD